MSFLTGEDADTDGSGEVEVDEAEVAAAREAETVADLMDSDANREIEAEVEEQVFDGLTEEDGKGSGSKAAAGKAAAGKAATAASGSRKETREPAKAAAKK